VVQDKKRREEQRMYCLEYVLKNQDLKKLQINFTYEEIRKREHGENKR
jgi:hypothetical protein